MKNLYPKGGKGRIHPSPGSPSASSVGSNPSSDVVAVLKLLPAAILVLTAALGDEDKEVLAYLITRSIHGPAAAVEETGEERRRCRRPGVGGFHRPMLDCGCFDCYTSFWSRWDCSPDREVIHQAIEAFEDHLTSSESGGGGGARARRRDRRAAEKAKNSEKEGSSKKAKDKQKDKAEKVDEEKLLEDQEEKPVSVSMTSTAAEDKGAGKGDEEEAQVSGEDNGEDKDVSGRGMELVAVERRRGWPDVMGLLNSRLWSLWSPTA